MLFGTTYLVATSGVLPQHRPLLLACLRVVPAALLLLCVARPRPGRRLLLLAGIIGSVQFGLFFAFFFAATDRLPNGVAAVVTNTGPLWVLGLSWVVLHERPSWQRWLAGGAGLGGVALVVGASTRALSPSGVAFGLLAAVALAVGLVATRRLLGGLRPLDSAALQLGSGAGVLLVAAAVFERRGFVVDRDLLLGTAYLSLILTAAPYVLLLRGVARIGPQRVALLSPVTPVIAALLAWVARGDALSVLQWLGLSVVVLALLGSQRQPPAGSQPVQRG